MQALLKQLRAHIELFNPSSFSSIFIGGGTPSTIEPHLYEPIFETIAPYIGKECEITIEANPKSATKEWLKSIKALGVNRLSLGVQSFNEAKLRFLGRAHNPKEAIEAIENGSKVGFSHISIDLIYDSALDTKNLLKKDIALALSLPIDHLSAYELILEENTPFSDKEEYKKDDESLNYFVKEQISTKLPWYEVSNYGIYQCRHNRGYWELKEYMGIGAGAVGFLKNRRLYPQTDLLAYIKNPLKLKEEHLTPQELRTEKIFLGLRSSVGVDKSLLDSQKVDILTQAKKVIQKGDKVYNPNYFLADEIALFLI